MGAFDTLQAARKEPRLVGSATTKAQVNLSTITINVPTGVQDGDLLVCFLSGFFGSIPPANIAGWGVLFTSGVTTTVDVERSEERRVGKECVGTCRTWSSRAT